MTAALHQNWRAAAAPADSVVAVASVGAPAWKV